MNSEGIRGRVVKFWERRVIMSVEDGDCGICLEWGIRLVVDGKYVLFGYLNEGGGN